MFESSNKRTEMIDAPQKLIPSQNLTCFSTTSISAVIWSQAQSAGETDLVKDHTTAEISFGQFMDVGARDQRTFFVYTPSCDAAVGCYCSFARLNCALGTLMNFGICSCAWKHILRDG